MAKGPSSWMQDLGRIVSLWGVAIAIAVVWVILDRKPPAWDQAEHLSLSMNHWWLLTHSNWLSAEGLRQMWLLTPKYPPVFYWVTASIHMLLGPGPNIAMLSNAVFALLLLIATYGLGRHLFSPQIGLLAAGLTLLMPRLLQTGLDFQLDFAVTALVAVSFWCLTVWRDADQGWRQWLWIVAFGLSYGLALMTKQSALLFLAVPIVWVSLTSLFNRRWGRLLQLFVGGMITCAVMAPWLSVNWVFQFSILENTNVRSAQVEGDPMLNTLAAWTYYWQDLPSAVSWVLLIVPLVGLVFWAFGLLPGRRSSLMLDGTPSGRFWLLTYIVGSYVLWSAIVNKDLRYIAPFLPALAVLFAWGLACWWRKWPWVTYATYILGALVALLTIFPVGFPLATQLADTLAPNAAFYPYLGEPYPHAEIVEHIAQAQPYQLSTAGGLQSTVAVNQHNISYYGKLVDYQVYGRQVGSRPSKHDLDMRSLSWFYAQGDPTQPWPPTGEDEQSQLVRKLESNPAFAVDRTWPLPDDTQLYLYRRQEFPVTVTALPESACSTETPRLSRVEMPEQGPPGQPLPITYEWTGRWHALRNGLVLLTWEPETATLPADTRPWIHDHGIGLGTLRPHPIQPNQTSLSDADINPEGCFQVTERTATFPPETLVAGEYRLVGTYVNMLDKSSQTLDIPTTSVTLNPEAPSIPAPELDWVTQLREVSRLLPQGPDFLDEVFDPIGRINLYDPIQNYTVQAEQSLQLRWQANPERVNYGYGLVLSQVLQLKVDEAIASLQQLVQQDADNPYAHAYLGFVNLYAFRPGAAQNALQPALEMAPDSPEIQGLSALASLFRGNLWGAWQKGRTAIRLIE
ncbi:glycosyltransferase family 39 protein [Oscillatoria sp. CS-180]|uniref:glycosyltransferase family 39 protein n=1 Tax=Oscillatoria sp. CS-180 TaxID=3021720 RepID=UPI00232A7FA1|nr:glycosyltransferase family 39 protein [Oscillatoria sp. CS-180]MDB9528681.1 glycosyltransferase family 39 protein [Oscillatoria sp. CS-180]